MISNSDNTINCTNYGQDRTKRNLLSLSNSPHVRLNSKLLTYASVFCHKSSQISIFRKVRYKQSITII